ncbi:TlpA family protein disulfide reductase [Solirubrobacter phytolaccae]|uniref:TlpA family protein disulfide reductase n=1 Tax=Solirubrobacter phytolaccae TaxID=1404360 RepID=A0A9X3S835_9ACTN|nr:TlpA disulfide reductase family protein [Solirubrobacter phytolaccae]MDA0181008.1 TlpA family protein disulfide reductase [Solirubrobacter phytolaccae]
MRRWLAVLAATVVVAGCGGDDATYDGGKGSVPGPVPDGVSYAPAETEAKSPPLELTLLDDTKLDVATLWRDRPTVLFFFASWCSRCAAQQDTLAAMGERYGDKVAFVGVAGKDTKEKLRPWLTDHKVGYPVGIDPDLKKWRQYAVRTPPAVVLVAPGGKLLRGWTGGVERGVLEDELEALVRD